jgi:hypothetical protein
MPPPYMALCVIAHVPKYLRDIEILGTTPMAPLETTQEENTIGLLVNVAASMISSALAHLTKMTT